jgi:hypothetical protein
MFDLVNQQQITTLVVPAGGIIDLSMASDGCTIAGCISSGQVLLYDLRNLKSPIETITSSSLSNIQCCSHFNTAHLNLKSELLLKPLRL